jgi:hypothetical protein
MSPPVRTVRPVENLTPRQQREALLVALYDQAGGSVGEFFEAKVAAQSIGLDPDRAEDHVVTLKQGGLVDHLTMGGAGVLTARGVAEAERLKQHAEQTAARLPLILGPSERADLEAFVGALDRAEIEQALHGDDLLEYKAELDTARAQARSPRPKRHIVRAAVARLIEFTVQTGANVAAIVIAKAAGL